MGWQPRNGARSSAAAPGGEWVLLRSVECGEGFREKRNVSSDRNSSISDIAAIGRVQMQKTVEEHR